MPKEPDPVALGHLVIGDNGIEGMLFHHLQRDGPGLDSGNRELAALLNEEFPQLKQVRFIVYVKNGIGVRHIRNARNRVMQCMLIIAA